MTTKNRYHLATTAVILLFIVLLGTEVADRWDTTLRLYREVQTKKALTPDSLFAKRIELRTKHQQLIGVLTKNTGRYL